MLSQDEIWAGTEPQPQESLAPLALNDSPIPEPPKTRPHAAKGPQLELALACPGCSARMEDRGCKRRCPKCGYFDDCSNLL